MADQDGRYDRLDGFGTTTLSQERPGRFDSLGGSSDPTAPTVGNVSPAPGAISRTQAVTFEVTDNLGQLVGRVIHARHASGAHEIVWDAANGFASAYTGSTTGAITNGFTHTITRAAGWPTASVTIYVTAFDAAGNAAAPASLAFTVTNPDASAPTIENFSPAKGGTVAAAGAVSFDAFDSGGSSADLGNNVQIYSTSPAGVRSAVYTGGAFQAGFSGTRNGTNNRHFSISKTALWVEPVVLDIIATDPNGNVTQDTYTLHLTGAIDTTAPTIGDVTPTPGTEITRTTPVFFSVTDDLAFRRIIIQAAFEDGTVDVVHDGDAFTPRYAGLSSRTVISGGFRFRVLRLGGWPSAPTITPFAIDTHGNEA